MARKQDPQPLIRGVAKHRHPKPATRDDAAQWRAIAERAGKVRDRAVGKSPPPFNRTGKPEETHEK